MNIKIARALWRFVYGVLPDWLAMKIGIASAFNLAREVRLMPVRDAVEMFVYCGYSEEDAELQVAFLHRVDSGAVTESEFIAAMEASRRVKR
jgi:hypothetical protein